jgi:ATP-dependent Clp protease protease subunit
MVADQTTVVSLDERLLASRVVVLGEAVDDAIANRLCAQLLYLESLSATEDIWLYVNSPGGSVTAGMAVYDTMQFIEPDVATVCMGLAASMGQFLLCAGAKGKRYSLPHTRILMHQPSGGVQGTAIDIAGQAENMRHTKTVMAERIALHTGQPVSRILEDWDRDHWFTPEEAKAYGMIDQVITRRVDLKRAADAA